MLDNIQLFVGAGGPEVGSVVNQVFLPLLALFIDKGDRGLFASSGFHQRCTPVRQGKIRRCRICTAPLSVGNNHNYLKPFTRDFSPSGFP